MMRILLTGGTGFVGKNLQKYLRDEGYTVTSVNSTLWDLRRQTTCEDMMDQIKPDIVIHAAGAVGGIGANQMHPGKFMYENLIMGTNVVHSCMLSKVNKLIMLGTVCSYPKFTNVPFKEEDMWNGYPEETNAPYGIAKHTINELTRHYLTEYGLNSVNLVPVNMYGPHDNFDLKTSHVIPALIRKIDAAHMAGEPLKVWGTGKASREFLHVRDFCGAVVKAIQFKEVYTEPINIGTGYEVTIENLIRELVTQFGFSGDVRYDQTKPDGQPRRSLSIERAADKLGYRCNVPLCDGLAEVIQWYRDNKETL
jgi:GDP-L-fucose synthase